MCHRFRCTAVSGCVCQGGPPVTQVTAALGSQAVLLLVVDQGSPMATSVTRIIQLLMMMAVVYYYERHRQDTPPPDQQQHPYRHRDAVASATAAAPDTAACGHTSRGLSSGQAAVSRSLGEGVCAGGCAADDDDECDGASLLGAERSGDSGQAGSSGSGGSASHSAAMYRSSSGTDATATVRLIGASTGHVSLSVVDSTDKQHRHREHSPNTTPGVAPATPAETKLRPPPPAAAAAGTAAAGTAAGGRHASQACGAGLPDSTHQVQGR